MEIERPHRTRSTPTTTSELFICFTSRLSHSSSMRLSSKSILSPAHSSGAADKPTSSLSRRLRHNGSLRGGAESPSPAMFPNAPKKSRGSSAFSDNPEPSSPKVTCIGQVRVKTKKHGQKMKNMRASRSKRISGGESSFRALDRGGSDSLQCNNNMDSSTNHHQRWVHLPLSICETLRAFGNEFSCLLPCKPSCFSNNEREKGGGVEEGRENHGGCIGGGGGGSSCGAVFRWFVSLQDGEEGGERRDIELVVGDEVEVERERPRVEFIERECSRRSSIFDDMEFDDLFKNSNNVGDCCNDIDDGEVEEKEQGRVSVCIPPKNALLLMRCRSDPVRMASLSHRLWEAPVVDDDDGSDGDDGDKVVEVEGKVEVVEEVNHALVVDELGVKEDIREEEIQIREEKEEIKEEIKEVGDEEIDEMCECKDVLCENVGDLPDCDEGLDKSLEGCEDEVKEVGEEETEEKQSIENRELQETEENQGIENCESTTEVEVFQDLEETHLIEAENLVTEAFTAEEKVEEGENFQDLVENEQVLVDKKDVLDEKEQSLVKMVEDEVMDVEEESQSSEISTNSSVSCTSSEESTAESKELELRKDEKEELVEEGKGARKSMEVEKNCNNNNSNKPMLPDCLLLMMCEPKLSMEVSKETWVCSTDFIRWLPERHQGKKGIKTDGVDEEKKKKVAVVAAQPQVQQQVVQPVQPGRSSISFPAGGGTVANLIEQKLAQAGVGCEPLVLTRCKSAPMRSTGKFMPPELGCSLWGRENGRKLEPHRPATCGAAGMGF